jgi:hypothetical protein
MWKSLIDWFECYDIEIASFDNSLCIGNLPKRESDFLLATCFKPGCIARHTLNVVTHILGNLINIANRSAGDMRHSQR